MRLRVYSLFAVDPSPLSEHSHDGLLLLQRWALSSAGMVSGTLVEGGTATKAIVRNGDKWLKAWSGPCCQRFS